MTNKMRMDRRQSSKDSKSSQNSEQKEQMAESEKGPTSPAGKTLPNIDQRRGDSREQYSFTNANLSYDDKPNMLPTTKLMNETSKESSSE